MNVKTWIPLSAALVLGGGAAYAGFELVAHQKVRVVERAVAMSDLIVASRGIAAGTKLTAEDLRVLRVAAESAPVGFVGSVEEAAGRVVVEAVRPGQAIGDSLLAEPGATAGLSGVMPRGYRALTLEFDRFTGVQEFLRPDARVDVVCGFRDGESMTVQTVSQNLRVLAIDGLLAGQEKPEEDDAGNGGPSSNSHSVTLMVTPEQAAAIELAAVMGKPRLTLRAGGDVELSPFDGLSLAQLRGVRNEAGATPQLVAADPWQQPPQPPELVAATTPDAPAPRPIQDGPAVADAAPSVRYVEIIRGGVVSRQAVPTTRAGSVLQRDPTQAAAPATPAIPATPPPAATTRPAIPTHEYVGNDERPAF